MAKGIRRTPPAIRRPRPAGAAQDGAAPIGGDVALAITSSGACAPTRVRRWKNFGFAGALVKPRLRKRILQRGHCPAARRCREVNPGRGERIRTSGLYVPNE